LLDRRKVSLSRHDIEGLEQEEVSKSIKTNQLIFNSTHANCLPSSRENTSSASDHESVSGQIYS